MTPTEIARDIEVLMTPAELAEAEYSIGQAYHEGDGVPENDTQASVAGFRSGNRPKWPSGRPLKVG